MTDSAQRDSFSNDAPFEKGETVALFVPCYVDQIFPNVAKATAALLERFGAKVVFPDRQTCCGQPAFNSGYWEEAKPVVRHFCECFGDHRWIVTPSGSCAAMCREFFGHVDSCEETVRVGKRVFELTEFLVDHMKVEDTGATFPHKVTLHSGCHGRRELSIVEQPRKLLQSVRGLEFSELPNVEECCGFGGTFSVKMPGMSIEMGKTKVANVLKSGADYVVSCDASCIMHFGGVLKREPTAQHVRALHIAEVLTAGW